MQRRTERKERTDKSRAGEDIRARHIQRQKKRRKRRMFLKAFLTAAFLFVLVAVLLFLTPWFNINTIDVVGNSHVESDNIIAQSEIYLGANIFKISTSHAQEKISRMPYIKSVNVKRSFPSKVVIEVTESHEAGYFEHGGGYILIDEDGKVLDSMTKPPQGCMKIVGCEIEENLIGEKIKIDSDEKFDIILMYIGEFEQTDFYDKVDMLDVSNTVDIKFGYDNRLTVYCGDLKDLDRKILTFTEVAFNQLSPNARGEIDLRIEGKTYYRP